ncbi:hypothetical protein MZO42_19140 [Sphingomonas psychrotolerans]|uniref:Uncharacterized protein n=1 Tax=Sphingomonas psychrotolerans TaxID=1327635 RepID=A0ABU3N921_9SPHN|nr:hypothetical protein [Sphingomonas psychrotolerans]MDT8760821.1 hypothetical protein [Sphingomonas psychrotolerans]
MSRKTSMTRREAFFRAPTETGNQTIAAERAKVSRSWVTLHRAQEPGFRARMEAIGAARARLRAAAGVAPATGWGSLDGEELVVRGSNGRRTQIARARLRQWTPRAEQRFLGTLAATCNVKAACAEVGLTTASADAHAERWPNFAARWAEAVEVGYMRIEAALLERAGDPGAELRPGPAHAAGHHRPGDPFAPHAQARGPRGRQTAGARRRTARHRKGARQHLAQDRGDRGGGRCQGGARPGDRRARQARMS